MQNPYNKINKDMECLKKNNCIPVIVGPTGPRGRDGRDGKDGVADTIEIRNTATGESGSPAMVFDNKIGNTHILDFVIPMGPPGKEGSQLLRSAYLVTFNDGTHPNGIEVNPDNNIPLERLELDVSNIILLDSTNNLIKFNVPGYYKITFIVNAYPEVHTADFDPTKDIVAIGFRETGTDHVYVGMSSFIYNGEAGLVTSTGVISVVDTAVTYELANIGNYPIYLDSPLLANIKSKSYFANPLVVLTIDYLGRQGS